MLRLKDTCFLAWLENLHSQLLVTWGMIFPSVRYHYCPWDQSLKIQDIKEGCITWRSLTLALALAFPLLSPSSHLISGFTQSVLTAHRHIETQTHTHLSCLSMLMKTELEEHSAGHCRWNIWNIVRRLEIMGVSPKFTVLQCWLPILAAVVWIVVGTKGMQINTLSTFSKVSDNYILHNTYCFKICSLAI